MPVVRDADRKSFAEIEREIARALKAVLAIFRETPTHEGFKRRMNRGTDPWRLFVQHGADGIGRGAAPKRCGAGQHLVQHRAEAEDVGPMVGAKAARLFRRHVAGRAHHRRDLHAGDRDRLRRVAGMFGIGQLCEPEVENLDPSVDGDKQVVGLDVEMNDPAIVSRREAAGDLDRVIERLRHRQRVTVQPLTKRRAVEQLCDDERRAIVDADLVDRDDIRVAQAACCARLALESADAIRIA